MHTKLALLTILLYTLVACQTEQNTITEKYPGSHPQAQAEMMMTYVDPATGVIPPGIRHKELAYAKTLPKRPALNLRNNNDCTTLEWTEAGPDNIGGRTRALAFDKTNPNIILAGGATGGIWKSTDHGESWQLKSELGSPLNVSTLTQDPRPEFSNNWYFATGELRGESGYDRGYTARNYGAGIYKSSDNGETWSVLPNSIPDNEVSWDAAFDFVHKVVVSPTTGTLFIANNGSGIYRSTDDTSFPRVLGSLADHLYNDIAVDDNGRLVAVMSSLRINWTHSTTGGVFISDDDGMTWEDITPPTFPNQHHRSLVAIAPSNPDIVYVLTYTGNSFSNNREDIRFHYLNLAEGTSEDRTEFLPNFPGTNPFTGPALHSLGSYCMALGIHPDFEDFVVIGGNAMYRSYNGFSQPIPNDQSITIIGGYEDVSGVGFPYIYPNHWVDQHALVFNPENTSEMWNGNDSGIYRTSDIAANNVIWDDKSRGYNTVQYFFVGMSEEADDGKIMGGAQDNGTIYFQDIGSNGNPVFTDGLEICAGDGSYGYFGKNYAYTSLQNGRARRANYLNAEQTDIQTHLTFQLVNVAPPPDANTSNMFYIHPYIIDPNDEKIMYFPEQNTIWRNSNLEAGNPLFFWSKLENIAAPLGYTITSLAVSRSPAHTLYFGATHNNASPKIYRLDNANTANSGLEDISIPGAAVGAYVHSIAVNPVDVDEAMVAFSNYNIYGLYHTIDGGNSWELVEGNLAGTINAPGPSIRSVAILPVDDGEVGQTLYLVGTSVGLFSTNHMDGFATEWQQEAPEIIGNAIAEMVFARPSDGRVAVGTFGRGIFIADLAPTTSITTPERLQDLDFRLYPIPVTDNSTATWKMSTTANISLKLFNAAGQVLHTYLQDETLNADNHNYTPNFESLPKGIYYLQLQVGTQQKTIKFVK